MHLYLSTTSPRNAIYTNSEGQVIYKVESPRLGFRPFSITIKRILPSNVANTPYNAAATSEGPIFSMAEIEYQAFTSRIRYNGIDIATNDFFKRTGLFWSNLAFRGPDGKEYEWRLGSTCRLYLKDFSDALVASHHHRKLGFLTNPRPASLEIFPQGQHMVDLIVVTFIFVEKIWSDRQYVVA